MSDFVNILLIGIATFFCVVIIGCGFITVMKIAQVVGLFK